MIRAVISDLGKVLLWFDNDIFIRRLAAHCDLSVEKIKEAAHSNMELITAFDKGGISPREFYERIVKAVGARISREKFFAIYNDIFWLNARAVEVLKRVKPTYSKLLLLSNTDPERFGFVRKRFSQILIFDDYVLSYELGLVKPEPGIYREAARRAGCAAGRLRGGRVRLHRRPSGERGGRGVARREGRRLRAHDRPGRRARGARIEILGGIIPAVCSHGPWE